MGLASLVVVIMLLSVCSAMRVGTGSGLTRSSRSSSSRLRCVLGGAAKAHTGAGAEVVVAQGKVRLFTGGNPLIYSGAVEKVLGQPAAGEEVTVVDARGNTIGRGYFNPHSQYRVRLMVSKDEQKLMNLSLEDIIASRIRSAKGLRRACDLPNEHTNAYRLINGEGDRLSGLVVDVLGDAVVVQSSAYWVEANRRAVQRAVSGCLEPGQRMVWRRAESRLKQDGWDVAAGGEHGEDVTVDPALEGASNVNLAALSVRENGVVYEVNAEDGQKTGFYCDQRDNRAMLRRLVQGKRVLDAYCYTGGFTLNCLLGGAAHVTAIDSSNPALQLARRNAELNGIDVTDTDSVAFVKGDAVKEMKTMAEQGLRFDVVIADPPKLAPSRSGLDRAKKKYVQVNMAALRLVAPGGLLLTHSCSGAVTQGQLLPSLVQDAAKQLGRQLTLLSTSGAAPCHPVHMSYRESAYLTALLFHVS